MPRESLLTRLTHATQTRAQTQLLRQLNTTDVSDHAYINFNGNRLLSFASNDYLGLSQHPLLKESLIRGVKKWGIGAGAAHLLGGHRTPHTELETMLAAWTQYPAALLFSSGYMANLGILSALLSKNDLCIQDKLNHASLYDGAKLAGCQLKRYPHTNIEVAQRHLQHHAKCAALLVTDGVFSMDGDVAPLSELSKLCTHEQTTLMVDDAHGIGVLGNNGAGSANEAKLNSQDIPIYMATLGKALGVYGAFVAGSKSFIEALIQFSRPFIYTTAIPPALACATQTAVQLAQTECWRREHLNSLIKIWQQGVQHYKLPSLASRTAIQPLLIGDTTQAMRIAKSLEAHGFYIPAIRSPTVPAHQARLRVTLSAMHQPTDVVQLLETLYRILLAEGICHAD